MNASSTALESELRVSPKPVIAAIVAFGAMLQIIGEGSPAWARIWSFALLIFAVAVVAWLLDSWKTSIGRWFLVSGLVLLVWFITRWFDAPAALAVMAIPVALAASLISISASTAMATGVSLLLLSLPRETVAQAGSTEMGLAHATMWAMVGVMYIVYRPVRELAVWSGDYLERAQGVLKEVRDHQGEFHQALDDLAFANRQLTLANEKLAAMRLVAEQAQKAKTAFLAKVSHEFRTPLNMIIGLTDLMVESPEVLGGGIPPKILRHLKTVHRNSEHLASMVDDVLDLSQAEAGRLALHRERVSLSGVVDKALAVVRPLVSKKGLNLRVDTPKDMPDVYCDRTRMSQVILNLVSNAARFTESGGITIRMQTKDRRVVVGVSDTGPGISPEDAERIFEPFCQGTIGLSRDRGGTGLGLTISKQFVEMHGGRMWLESELGVGSTFFFSLPTSPPVRPVAGAERWIVDGWQERATRADVPGVQLDRRLIVCDDSGVVHECLTRHCDDVEFIDTRDLAQTTRELEESPAHAVIVNATVASDLWPLVEQARQRIPDTPIIGCCCPPRIEHAFADSLQGYLTKPVTRADLDKGIRDVGRPVKRVLAVDDDVEALELLTLNLRACDSTLQVATATNGQEALEELRKHPPDLLLLDIVMPGMDGWELLAMKRLDAAIRDVPVIALSGQDPRERPVTTGMLVATMGNGLSVSQLLRCSREIPGLLLRPDQEPGPMPG